MCDFSVKTISNDENLIKSNETINCEINDLNEYVLQQIFSYFSMTERIYLSQVCFKWQLIIEKSFKSELVLNRKTILGERENICELGLALIIRKCCNVRHIVLSGIIIEESERDDGSVTEEEGDILISSIAENCTHLETIDFGYNYVCEEKFILFGKYFSRVKKIVAQNISEEALNCIIDSPNIECIDITNNEVIDVTALHLRRLGPKIRELYLIGIEYEPTDETWIRDLCQGNGKHIKNLSIDITDDNLLPLICSEMIAIQTLKLNIHIDGDECDFTQFSNFKDLTTFHMNVEDYSLFTGLEFFDLFRSLKGIKLKEIQITLTEENEESFNDHSLHELSRYCCALEKLVIRGSNSMTNDGMESMAQFNCLKHIDFKDCLSICDENIEIVINSCPLVSHLNLHNCSLITDKTVRLVIEKANQNLSQKFQMDVINTKVEEIELEVPSNMHLLLKIKDCVYDCNHNSIGGYYDSDSDDDYKYFYGHYNGYDDDFYDEDDDEEYED